MVTDDAVTVTDSTVMRADDQGVAEMEASRLRTVALFEGLDDEELARCAAQFEEVKILAGSGMIREGDFAYRCFDVLDGEVEVLQDFEQYPSIAAHVERTIAARANGTQD